MAEFSWPAVIQAFSIGVSVSKTRGAAKIVDASRPEASCSGPYLKDYVFGK
jgi:hypothetical protein